MGLANKDISRIKMVALTENGHKNVTWYSPTKQNHKDDDFIINGMMRRYENRAEYNFTRVIQFYSTKTDELIAQYKRTNKQ